MSHMSDTVKLRGKRAECAKLILQGGHKPKEIAEIVGCTYVTVIETFHILDINTKTGEPNGGKVERKSGKENVEEVKGLIRDIVYAHKDANCTENNLASLIERDVKQRYTISDELLDNLTGEIYLEWLNGFKQKKGKQ